MQSCGHAGTMLAAAILMAWLVARAHLQSITIDEAISFSFFVDRPGPLHWYPAAANHVLQTMLSRLSVMVFGISHLSLRLPTLLAAAAYIVISLRFCARLTKERHLQFCGVRFISCQPFRSRLPGCGTRLRDRNSRAARRFVGRRKRTGARTGVTTPPRLVLYSAGDSVRRELLVCVRMRGLPGSNRRS